MKVAANTLDDIQKRERAKLQDLLFERSVLAYSFSYRKLAALLDRLDCPDINGELEKCIMAFSEEDAKAIKEDLNDKISGVFMASGLRESDKGSITLLTTDPFGRQKDFIYMESKSRSFSEANCIDTLVRKFKLPAEAVAKIFRDNAKMHPYVTVQARDHKEENHRGKKRG